MYRQVAVNTAALNASSVGARRSRSRAALFMSASVVALAIAGALSGPVRSQEAQTLPGTVIKDGGVWSGARLPTVAQTNQGLKMTIEQEQRTAILDWSKFNIAAGEEVHFDQQAVDWIALNRIFDIAPSEIAGKITATGQVWLTNQNGIVFKDGAQVNAHTILATSAPINSTNLASTGTQPFNNNYFAGAAGDIVIESGAMLKAVTSDATTPGKVILFGVNVENHGHIEANDGQVMMAAGEDFYIYSQDGGRGLRMDVNPRRPEDSIFYSSFGYLGRSGIGGCCAGDPNTPLLWDQRMKERAAEVGMRVVNTGEIVAQRGDISWVGADLQQLGTLRATSGVRQRPGTINFTAGYGHDVLSIQSGENPRSFVGGSLVFGEGSVTEVTPDLSGETAQVVEPFSAGSITIEAKDVLMEQNSVLRATAGTINMFLNYRGAAIGFSSSERGTGGSLTMRSGSLIDVSGLDDVVFDAASNIVQVEVRSNELSQSPNQRGGILEKEIVNVDVREGTTVVDWTGALDNRQQTAAQRSINGGSVNVRSVGTVVVEDGATIDISGGNADYQAGWVDVTLLKTADGRTFDLADADPNQTFTGIATQQVFQDGYKEGGDAGALSIYAPGQRLFGNVVADTVIGDRQRAAAGGLAGPKAPAGAVNGNLPRPSMPYGGSIEIGTNDNNGGEHFNDRIFITPDENAFVGIFKEPVPGGGFTYTERTFDPFVDLPDGATGSRLSSFVEDDFLSGVQDITVQTYAEGGQLYSIEVVSGANLNVVDGGSITISSADVYINSGVNMTAPSGNITLAGTLRGIMEGGVNLSVAGRWVNDADAGPNERVGFVDGGSIVYGGVIDGDVTFDLSGGGWRREVKPASATPNIPPAYEIVGGAGGTLSLNVNDLDRVNFKLDGLAGAGSLSIGGLGDFIVGPDGGVVPSGHYFDPRYFSASQIESWGVGSLFMNSQSFSKPVNDELIGRSIGTVLRPNTNVVLFAGGVVDASVVALLQGAGVTSVSVQSEARMLAGTDLSLSRAMLELTVDPALIATGADLSLFTQRRNVPAADRLPTSFNIGTSGAFVIEEGASITADPGSAIRLGGLLDIAGDITAHGGTIEAAGRLRSSATLDVSGIARTQSAWQDGTRTRTVEGDILGGGSIVFSGSVDPGALLDVSGASSYLTVDVPTRLGITRVTQLMGSNAGSITINGVGAGASGYFLGDIRAAAGVAAARGGVLTIGGILDTSFVDIPTGPLAAYTVGASVLDDFADLDTLNLGISQFNGDVTIRTRRLINVGSPLLSSLDDVTLEAAQIVFSGFQDGTPGQAVSGSFLAKAGVIDVPGNVRFDGFADVTLEATDELRGGRTTGNLAVTAGVRTAAPLTIRAAQIYPQTGARLNLISSDSLTVESVGSSFAPLSAGGYLYLEAPTINQGGVLRAPFGTIELNGENVNLLPGSLTSVSAEDRVILYGTTVDGATWFAPNNQNPNPAPLTAPPEKRIIIGGANVDVQEGALIDASGGGDVLGLEFVPGSTGQVNVLNGAFAIVPAYGTEVAGGGDQIYLEAFDGHPAGWYTLLPAEYALVPGGYRVTLSSSSIKTPVKAGRQLDGTFAVSGYQGVRGTDIQGQTYSTYSLMSGAEVRRRSQFYETSGNSFFSSQRFLEGLERSGTPFNGSPRLPIDGGFVTLQAREKLSLDGTLLANGLPGRRGGIVDISSENIVIASAGTDVSDLTGYLVLDPTQLSNLMAESLLIGGIRRQGTTGVEIVVGETVRGSGSTVGAANVVVRNGEEDALTGPEILLAALDQVLVEQGSVIRAVGDGADAPDVIVAPALPAKTTNPQLPAQDHGALLRVSNLGDVRITRTSVNPALAGDLVIEAGAKLEAVDAVILDSTRSTTFAPGAIISAKAITAASGSVSIGAAPIGTGGFVLDNNALALLTTAERVRLTSYSTTTFYGDVDLAIDKELVLDTGALVSDGNVHLTAETLRIENSSAATYAGGTPGGTLTLEGQSLVLGAGDVTLDFNDVNVDAERMLFAGQGGTLSTPGTFTASIAQVTAESGASHGVTSAGAMEILTAGAASTLPEINSIGGNLRFTGSEVLFDASVRAGSGSVSLTAATGDVRLGSNAKIDVSGSTVEFFDVTEYLSGGNVRLTSVNGDVITDAGSLINVAGGAGGGDAGTLTVSAGRGAALFNGNLDGHAAATYRTGAFSIETEQLGDFTALNALLNDTGFTRERRFSVVSGDAVITGETQAENFYLVTGTGSITVAAGASIVTTGDKGGHITLMSGGALTVEDGALLDASAKGEDERGGIIALAVGDAGSIGVGAANFNVSATGDERAGEVRLRAPQIAGADGVAVTRYDATVTGGGTTLEAYKITDLGAGDGVIDAALQSAVISQATTWFNDNAASIRNRLGQQDSASFLISPGVEIRAGGDITMENAWNTTTNSWDLHNVRFGVERAPGVLTLRAGGDLNIKAALSDGMMSANWGEAATTNDLSWSYNLVAGADFQRTDVLSTIPSATGEGDIRAYNVIRTGTGEINVAASGDLLYPGPSDYPVFRFNQIRRNSPAWSTFIVTTPDGAVFTYTPTSGSRTTITVPNVPGIGNVTWRPGGSSSSGHFNFGGVAVHLANSTVSPNEAPTAPDAQYGQPFDGAIYTTGVQDTTVIPDFNTPTSGRYLVDGGDVNINIGGGSAGYRAPPSVGNFFDRRGRVLQTASTNIDWKSADKAFTTQTSESILIQNFRQNVGSLGGGDINVDAGGTLNNFSVSAPTTTRVSGGLQQPDGSITPKVVHVTGGGDLTVSTGGDILGGWYYGSRGNMQIDVAGSVGRTSLIAKDAGVDTNQNATWFITDIGQMRVTTGGDLLIGVISSGPMAKPSSFGNAVWIGYTQETSMRFLSLGGDIGYLGTGGDAGTLRTVVPNDLDLIAANGSIVIGGPMIADSLPDEGVNLLAWDGIGFAMDPSVSGDFLRIGSLMTSSMTPEFLPRVVNPSVNGITDFQFDLGRTGDNVRGEKNPHAGQDTVARVYAVNGDIGDPNVGFGQGSLKMGYEARIRAGGDIRLGSADFQTHDPDDFTLVEAGGAIYTPNYLLRGEGHLVVQAGDEIYFGNTPGQGIRTYLQIDNEVGQFGQLVTRAENGGDVTVLAGIDQAPNYAGFFDYYLGVGGVADKPSYLREVFTFDDRGLATPAPTLLADGATQVTIYAVDLVNYMRDLRGEAQIAGTDESGRPLPRAMLVSQITKAEYDQALADFAALDPVKQRGLASDILFGELKSGGREAVGASPLTDPRNQRFDNPNRGYLAVGLLYPGAQKRDSEALATGESRWQGDVVMVNSQIRSDGGGDIDVITPGGLIQLASLAISTTSPGSSGVVTQFGGNINMLAGEDVIVNRSRILTADDGDILVWSSFGDIDAGGGRKTSLSIPAIRYEMDGAGTTRLLRAGIPNGAGIASLNRVDGTPGGDVDLYAFDGIVDAGDAGIRASRDLFIGAIEIRNLDNITVGGQTNVELETEEGTMGPLNVENFAEDAEDEALKKAFSIAEEVEKLRRVRQTILTGAVVNVEEESEEEKKKKK